MESQKLHFNFLLVLLAGAFILSLFISKPNEHSESGSLIAGGSPTLPAGKVARPMWIRPFRKVPVVTITALAL